MHTENFKLFAEHQNYSLLHTIYEFIPLHQKKTFLNFWTSFLRVDVRHPNDKKIYKNDKFTNLLRFSFNFCAKKLIKRIQTQKMTISVWNKKRLKICWKAIFESTFSSNKFNLNRHALTLSFNVRCCWFHCFQYGFDDFGLFYLKNTYLARRKFELTTIRIHFRHLNTKPHPSVHGFSTSWKLIN
jgi:hypothetical protein